MSSIRSVFEATGKERYAVSLHNSNKDDRTFMVMDASSPEEAVINSLTELERGSPDQPDHYSLKQMSNGVWTDGVNHVYDLSSPDARRKLGEHLVEELETVEVLGQGEL